MDVLEGLFKKPQAVVVGLNDNLDALSLPQVPAVAVEEVRSEVVHMSEVVLDPKSNNGAKVRTSGNLEEVLRTPARLLIKSDIEEVQGDLLFGDFEGKMAGFRLVRFYEETVKRWRLRISYPQKDVVSLFGSRFLIATGTHDSQPRGTTQLIDRLKEYMCEGAIILPAGVEPLISDFTQIPADSSFATPILDIAVDGKIRFLLPVLANPLEIVVKIHPGPETVL